jgi:hypothetical protein
VARPAKTLQERVRNSSFVATHHGGLLAGPPAGSERLRAVQERYRQADTDVERRAQALANDRKTVEATK